MFAELLSQGGLSLERLQSFCLVAEASGVTKAARGDPTKQSLYSRQVKELEEFFGAELVRRKGRGIVLTAAGERLNVLARECFASLLDFKSACKGLPVEVVIGAGESVIEWVLMPRLAEVRKKLPNVRLKFLNLATSEVVRRLTEGVIDFGVVRRDAVARPLQCVSLGVMGYSLFVPEGLAGVGTGMKALETVPLATLEGEGSFRRELAAIARKNRLPLKIEIECASFPAVARAVATGSVAAVLPSVAVVELGRLGAKEIRFPVLDGLKREICLAWSPRLMRIRPALDNTSKVFAQVFKI
jgi:LysR family transcriptional regulator, nitrogen assimilation regulatory protein